MKLRKLCGLVLAVIAIAALSAPAVSADVDVDTGDWWEYEFTMEIPDMAMSLSGTMRMEITKVVQESVMGQMHDVFVMEFAGSASFSGTYLGYNVVANMTLGGEIHRLRSNFSMLSSKMSGDVDLVMMGMTVSMSMGADTDYEPVMNDYVGDEDLTTGTVIHSHSEATSSQWTNAMGTNQSSTSTDEVDLTMRVVATDVTVSTPAGDFSCYKITATGETPDDSSYSTTYYYSDEVGNYVKIEGDGDIATGLPSMTLTAYSRGGGILSSTTTMLLIGVVVAAVVIVAVVLLAMRGRRRTPSPVPPPQPGPEPYMPPPPPPPPGQ